MGLAGVLADMMGARMVFVRGGVVVSLAGVVALMIFRGAEIHIPVANAPAQSAD